MDVEYLWTDNGRYMKSNGKWYDNSSCEEITDQEMIDWLENEFTNQFKST